MTNIAIWSLVLGILFSGAGIATWRSGGRGLLPVGMLQATFGAAVLAPAGWPRYVLIAAYIGLLVWILARTPAAVLYRFRWSLALIGAAIAGIWTVVGTALVPAGWELVALAAIGLLVIAGLGTSLFLALQALRDPQGNTQR